MGNKILIADDSANIQKVVGIILSRKNYQIIDCLSYLDLDNKIKSAKPDLLLLDFTLSDQLDGYTIVKQLKTKYIDLKVILLFGTFDTVDERKIKDSLTDDYIYKPFDGDKLTKICTSILGIQNVSLEDDFKFDESIEKTQAEFKLQRLNNIEEDDEEDQWGVSIPSVIENSKTQTQRIPGVIGQESKSAENTQILTLKQQENALFPAEGDLEYPEEISSAEKTRPTVTLKIDVGEDVTTFTKHTPKFISLDELSDISTEEEREESTELVDTNKFNLPSKDDTGIRKLRAQLEDEVKDSFWEPDDRVETPKVNLYDQSLVSPHITDKKEEIYQKVAIDSITEKLDLEAIKKEIKAEIKDSLISALMDEIRNDLKFEIEKKVRDQLVNLLSVQIEKKVTSDLKNELLTAINKNVAEQSLKVIEKCTWDLVPDLAEKYIKKEIAEIKKSID